MKKYFLIKMLMTSILISVFFTSCGKNDQYWLGHNKIELEDDQKITSFQIFIDTGTYTWKIQPIENFIELRRYIYRVKAISNNIKDTPIANYNVNKIKYTIEIIDDYNSNSGIIGKQKKITYISHPQIQLYRSPRLIFGEEYIMIAESPDKLVEGYIGAMFLRIDEIDGVEYVYPYIMDCSSLKNNLPITDPMESAIYKDYSDWDVLEYLEKHDIENPTFYFKFELNDFVNQVSAKQSKK